MSLTSLLLWARSNTTGSKLQDEYLAVILWGFFSIILVQVCEDELCHPLSHSIPAGCVLELFCSSLRSWVKLHVESPGDTQIAHRYWDADCAQMQ